jgi:protein gp37
VSGPTRIEWCDFSWNPWSGCSKVSPGCAHCYAETWAERFAGSRAWPNGFGLTMRPHLFDWPLTKRADPALGRAARIFVNSMSDVFLEEVGEEAIQRVFDVMVRAPWHDFLILTKRHERMLELAPRLPWPPNVWMGVSVENRRFVHRAQALLEVPAAIRFISAEPLLGPLDGLGRVLAKLNGPGNGSRTWRPAISWVIVGGESGPGARPMDLDWARAIRDDCHTLQVAFFLKQLGGHPNKRGHDQALLDGRLWREVPQSSMVAEGQA